MIRPIDPMPVVRTAQSSRAGLRFMRHGGWVVGLSIAAVAILGAVALVRRQRRERELDFSHWDEIRRSPGREQFHRETGSWGIDAAPRHRTPLRSTPLRGEHFPLLI